MRQLLESLLSRLFPVQFDPKLDGSSLNYRERLERANLPYRTFSETVVRVVPGSLKEGLPAPPLPPRGTRASRAWVLATE